VSYASVTPEPGSILLVGGALAFCGMRRKLPFRR
jgi:hypothetical protein